MKKSCPECGRQVEARLAPSPGGLGVLPYAFQVLHSTEHDRTCKYHLVVTVSSGAADAGFSVESATYEPESRFKK